MVTQMTLEGPAREAERVPLRPYQAEAVEAVLAGRERGLSRMLLSMATGAGKTFTAVHLTERVGLPRTLFLVHRDELATQAAAAYRAVDPSLVVGVVKAERDDIYAPVMIASAQTLAVGSRLERLRRAITEGLFIISDEAHHDMSPSRRRAIETLAPTLLVGLTATPSRADKVGLDSIYEEIVYHLPMLPLIAMGKLAPLVGLRIDTETDLDAVHTRAGELAEDELVAAVDTPGRNALIVQSYQRHAAGRSRTVAFCVNVAHAEHLATAFRDAGIRAACVFGHTPTEERRATLEAFGKGEIPVLVNVMVLSEGYDEPGIDCILWARPTKSQGLYIQCIGRAARKSEATGKTSALIIDFVDASSRHRLITLPVLAGAEGAEVKPGGGYERAGEQVPLLELAQRMERVKERQAVAIDLFGGSPYLWRTVAGWHFTPAGKGRYLVLEERPGGYVPSLLEDMGNGTRMTPLFGRPLDMETAIGVAETNLTRDALTARDAPWRSVPSPASPAQLELARKLRLPVTSTTTKAEASLLIDDAFFGRAIKRAGPRCACGHGVGTHNETSAGRTACAVCTCRRYNASQGEGR